MTSPSSTPPISHVCWKRTIRVISTLYPPLDLFEGLAPPEDWEALIELESLTNDRLRDGLGEISLVPHQERVGGPGAAIIMAAFTHPGRSRFSNGTYGVYYAGLDLETAVAESAHSQGRFYADSNEPPCNFDMRAHYGTLDGALHDVRQGYPQVHSPNSHEVSQRLGQQLRSQESCGLVYNSVRHQGGECVAVFRPSILKNNRASHTWQGPVFKYHWDGKRVNKYFNHDCETWTVLPQRDV